MKVGYGRAFEAARNKPGAAEVYERIEALPERSEGWSSSRRRQVGLLHMRSRRSPYTMPGTTHKATLQQRSSHMHAAPF